MCGGASRPDLTRPDLNKEGLLVVLEAMVGTELTPTSLKICPLNKPWTVDGRKESTAEAQ